MIDNKFFMLGLIGCVVAAAAYAIRRNALCQAAILDKKDLKTWEGEGGSPALPAARIAQAG